MRSKIRFYTIRIEHSNRDTGEKEILGTEQFFGSLRKAKRTAERLARKLGYEGKVVSAMRSRCAIYFADGEIAASTQNLDVFRWSHGGD